MIVGSPTILNLVPGGVMKCVHVNQVNKNIEIQFKIMNGAAPYNLPEGVTCTIRGTKGDAFGYAAEAAVTAGSNVITVTLTEQLTAVAGAGNIFELVFVGAADDMKVSTENFILAVERQAMGEDTVISDSDLSYAEQVLDQLQNVGAVNAQAQQNKANLAAEISRAQAAEAAETAARQAADNTLQSNINSEAATRATADASLQSQINQLIAPEGAAPSAAEVENARVGADGTVYQTLGDAIRTQVTNVSSAFDDFVGKEITASPASDWEQGELATTTGAELYATNRIRTVSTGIPRNVRVVNATNGYKFLAYAWAGSTYLGIWTGSGFIKQSASGLVITELDLRLVYAAGAAKVRLVLMRSTTSESIVPSEGTNLVYTLYENYIPLIKEDLEDVEEFVDAVKAPYQSGNIYQARTDDVNNRYYYRNSSGILSVGINTDYIGFIVPVIPNRTYTFIRSNLLLLKGDKTLINTSGGNYDAAGVRTYYSGDAYYFAISVRRADIPGGGYVMSMGDSLDDSTYSDSVYANPVPPKRVLDSNSISGSLADGEEHIISGKFGPRDGYYVAFHGTFSSFGTVAFKFNGYNVTNAVSVNSTNLVIVSGIGNTITQAHGLTISNAVAVLLELKNSVMYITVESGGTKYQYHCPWYWTGSSPSEIGVSASGMSFTNSKISLRVASANRSIWYFGDSYAEFNTDARFPYYMAEYGFDKNVMFNSISGSSSAAANDAFTALLAYGNPKYAVNALGMNDGSDTNDTTPNAKWLANIQTFINLCERHDIIPVLCTVPTIPTVNNNGKNAWVKASGYRYIDMAGAVGADASGNWYTGMLSSDNIHPSALGAVAQFMQLITDMPEVMG